MTRKRTVMFSPRAVNLFFHILTRCNLQCRHCYINPAQHGTETLPLATIETWLAGFAALGKPANLILLGGEPTLHPELAAVVKTARRQGFASVTIDTNGYLFHDILARITPDELDYFSFSLDGATAATNDALRGKGSYAACLAGIQRAVARGFSTSLIYTVSTANIDELALMAPVLKDLGIDRLFIQVLGIRGNPALQDQNESAAGLQQVDRDQWLAIVPAAAEKIAQKGITVTYPKVFLEPEDTFACAGQVADNYFVFPNGRVYRCPLCEDFPLHSLTLEDGVLKAMPAINEKDLFALDIPEGCVMNRLVQPGNLSYGDDGAPAYRIACCLLKEEVLPPGDAR
ncbi:MAG: radical SAM protein [Desulfobacterales bacterium]|jgi:MoaA/NifB/PqqE/SkfB family radical SAM enzyme